MEHKQNVLNVFVGNDEDQSAVVRPWRRCEDNVKTNLKEIEQEVVNWIHLAQDVVQWRAVVNTVLFTGIAVNISTKAQ